MKPGYKTTEFYLTLLSQIVGSLLASGLLDSTPTALRILGLLAALLSGLGYKVARTIAKSNDAKVEALAITQAPKA